MGNTLFLYKEHYEKQIHIHIHELQAGLNCLILIIYIFFSNMTNYFINFLNYLYFQSLVIYML